jgi:hypothetical protein
MTRLKSFVVNDQYHLDERGIGGLPRKAFAPNRKREAALENLDTAMGTAGAARDIRSRFGEDARLATLGNDDVEFEARSMVRELIERTAWFHHGMSEDQRQETIAQDVDRHWPLFAADAAKRLIDRVARDDLSQHEWHA